MHERAFLGGLMKRFVRQGALAPALVLIVVAAACGGASNVDIDEPFTPDASSGGTTSGTSGTTSGASSSSGAGSSSSGAGDDDDVTSSSSSSSSTGGVDGGNDGGSSGLVDAGKDSSVTDSGVDSGTDSGTDAGTIGTYVSNAIGLDSNPGTKAAPVKTITKGIANAVKLGGTQTVFVAGGTYGEKVTLVEGVSVSGGYLCNVVSCTWTQDAVSNLTTINNTDSEGVLAGSTITRKTRLEGFRVLGKDGTTGSANSSNCLSLDGGSPTIQGNTFNPGAVNGGAGRAVGIAVISPSNDPAGALIDTNRIQGGSASNGWVGISFERKAGGGANAIARVVNNTIRGGLGASSFGIAASSSAAATLIQDNTILAGTSTGNGGSWGIQVSSSLTIDRNRINLDTANAGLCNANALCGGIASLSSTTTITNNVVFGVRSARSTAVLLSEAEGTPGPVVLNANYLDGAGGGIAVGGNPTVSSGVWMRICSGGGCGNNAVIGRVRNNIILGGNNSTRYGVFEEQVATRTAHPDKLDSNDFFFAPAANRTDALYHLWNGTTATDLKTTAELTASVPTTPAPANNLALDPMVDATFHLGATSPLFDKGTATDAPALDFDGEKRPKGVTIDIGPDEAN